MSETTDPEAARVEAADPVTAGSGTLQAAVLDRADAPVTGRWRVLGLQVLAGSCIAAAMPPWGWWPLAFVGVALADRLLAGQGPARRFGRMWLTALVWYLPTLIWIGFLTAPGYVIACAFYAAMFGVGAAAVPARAPLRWAALPAAWALVEMVKGRWPFGGVPVATLAHTQAAAPLAQAARIGALWLVIALTATIGVGLSAALARRWRAVAVAGATVALVLAVAGAVAPRGTVVGTIEVALVQGGGPQGTRATPGSARVVFERHLVASREVPAGVDVVLWPENVIDVEGWLPGSWEGDQVAALARQLDAPLLVGVVEGDGPGFHNSQVVAFPDGTWGDRYEKVRRVPFGEYVPLRALIERFAGDDLVSRDAYVGQGPAVLTTPDATFGVVISWEVFFTDRARDAIASGGEVLLNPTNGASYTGTFLQTQQIASSRLRAIETGRWLVQAAPTGFSAFVDPDGTVRQRTAVSEAKVLVDTVERRVGDTWTVRWGDQPWLALYLVVLVGAAVAARRQGDAPSPAPTLTDPPSSP